MFITPITTHKAIRKKENLKLFTYLLCWKQSIDVLNSIEVSLIKRILAWKYLRNNRRVLIKTMLDTTDKHRSIWAFFVLVFVPIRRNRTSKMTQEQKY